VKLPAGVIATAGTAVGLPVLGWLPAAAPLAAPSIVLPRPFVPPRA
jgi:hypothetical protein